MIKIPTVVKVDLPFSDLWLTEEGIGVQRRFGGASWRFTSVCFLHIYFLSLCLRLARRRSALCCAFLPGERALQAAWGRLPYAKKHALKPSQLAWIKVKDVAGYSQKLAMIKERTAFLSQQ
jgi:hypothetical protein